MTTGSLRFEQIHIDVARNSTDDFNPFHDPLRWRDIASNPFGGTIALGFQTAFLVADRVRRQRISGGETALVEQHGLHFSNFDFLFAGALRPGEGFDVEVRRTVDKTGDGGGLSNRVLVRKAERALALMGSVSETAAPRFLADADDELARLPRLAELPDRSASPDGRYFVKRKFMNTSNGKNFTLGALCEQHDYFDELSDRVQFAPMFSAALLSCALLERGWAAGYDFCADPLVYTAHQISVDNRVQRRLRSNTRLHLLVDGPLPVAAAGGLGQAAVEQQRYRCFALLDDACVLLRANLMLAPLHAILAAG